MTAMILSWMASYWLLIAAVVVGIAAIANPVMVWKLKAWILLAVVLWWGWTGHAAADSLQAKIGRQTLKLAEEKAKASEEARKKDQARVAESAAIAKQYEQDKADAQAKHDRVVADIRSGQLRLRKQWTCPAAEAGATPGESDGAARLREQDAADLVRAAAEADAQVRGLQRVIEADRK